MSRERSRTREPEPEPESIYEQFMPYYEQVRERQDLPYVIRGDDRPWELNRQGKLKYYSTPFMDDVVLPDVPVFRHEIPDRSGRHTHQGGLALLGTRGQGTTVVDDERVEWEAGDLVTLPIKPGGVTHQHLNRNGPDEPAEWLAIYYNPHLEILGAEFTQNETSNEWDNQHHDGAHGDEHEHDHDHGSPDAGGSSQRFEDFDYGDWLDYEPPNEVDTLYDDLVVRRNLFRKQMATAQEAGNWGKVAGSQLDWEWNPQGKMKWYLHPAYDDRSMKTLLYAIQEIPPGSRSGKQHRQGSVVHYVLEGSGYSIVNGERYDWSAGDYLGLPVHPKGLTVQHFNDDPENDVRFVVASPAMYHTLGYDMGCGFEQIESCPEYSE